jgi:hypothetical protein
MEEGTSIISPTSFVDICGEGQFSKSIITASLHKWREIISINTTLFEFAY